MEPGRLNRVRWRMRGAWLWPTFMVLTACDGLVIDRLPFDGAGPGSLPGALLLAGFANLVAVAVPGKLLARRVRRRRPDLPRAIAEDYTGTALVWLLAGAFVVGGLAHRPELDADRAAGRAALAALHDYVVTQAPQWSAGLTLADAMRLEPGLYRACVPDRHGARWLCLFITTGQAPPGIRRDPSTESNAALRHRVGSG